MSRRQPSALLPVTPVNGDEQVALVLFPGAGAGPGYFRDWRQAQPHQWALLAANLPGRGMRHREPFATDLDALAFELAEAVAGLAAVRTVLLGHSFGGILAAEVARRLPRPPEVLAAVGSPPPQDGLAFAAQRGSEDDLDLLRRRLFMTAPKLDEAMVSQLAEITARVTRADMNLLAGYRPSAVPLSCKVLAFYAENDNVAPESWAAATSASSQTVVLPGNHFTVCDVSRDAILAQLRHSLDNT